MSWIIRSAVNKAVEVGGSNNITRAVRSYADNVVNQAGQAVLGGSRLLQDRIGGRNFQSYKVAVKRLEEVSISCRGVERVQLLRRWFVALKEIERYNEVVRSEELDKFSDLDNAPIKPVMVMYYDPDFDGEPMNFRDVFLHSQALEGITLSMILEEPNQEEISLLTQIFGLCLMGGKEARDVAVSSVQDLARAFSSYNEEILAKREELLQYAQDAIAGLKVNAEIVRVDSEVSEIHKRLDGLKKSLPLIEDGKSSSEKASEMSIENLKETLIHVRLCSRLEELLLRKKLLKNGDSPAAHSHKVDKLKILSESLGSSASKAENRISENRIQKEEALKFRVAKTSEVTVLEKELTTEIKYLQQRKDELEDELKRVTTALISANARLFNAREERDQFDEASNQIIQHFQMKDDELSKSIASYRAEAAVCSTFVNFLESTWDYQSSYVEQKEKLVNDELEQHEDYFMNLAIHLLGAYKEELGRSISSFQELVENLKRLEGINTSDEKNDAVNSRRSTEEQYTAAATKLITVFSIVENIKKQYHDSRMTDDKVNELLDAIQKMQSEFESVERPTLLFVAPIMLEETPSKPNAPKVPRQVSKQKSDKNLESATADEGQKGMTLGFNPINALPLVRSRTTKAPETGQAELETLGINGKSASDAAAQLNKLKMELELENHSRANSMDGNIDWEFEEFVTD